MKTMLIINPASSRGRTLGNWRKAEAEFVRSFKGLEVAFTERPGHAEEIARAALHDGFQWIISMGGDGTLSEVVNGFFEKGRPVNPDAALSVIASGTGGDFRRTAEMPAGAKAGLRHILNAGVKKIDAGHIRFTGHDGSQKSRYFINIASFGMSGEVDRRVNRARSGRLGPGGAFLIAAASAFLTYRNKSVSIEVDGKVIETRTRLALVCNGKYAGGGMKFAPLALPDDGLFDVVIIGDLGAFRTVINFPRIFRGNHLERKGATFLRGREVRASSGEEVLLDIDGEDPGRLPARFTIVPGAINLRG